MRTASCILIASAALCFACLAGDVAHAAGKAKSKSTKAGSAARTEQLSRAAVALEKLGLYHGDTSGRLTPELHVALEAFQKGRGLKPSGRLNKETRVALGLEAAAAPKKSAKLEMPETP